MFSDQLAWSNIVGGQPALNFIKFVNSTLLGIFLGEKLQFKLEYTIGE